MLPWNDQPLNTMITYQWTVGTTYESRDTVVFNSVTYVCLHDHVAVTEPNQDVRNWRVLTASGYNPNNQQITPYLPAPLPSAKTVVYAFWPNRMT